MALNIEHPKSFSYISEKYGNQQFFFDSSEISLFISNLAFKILIASSTLLRQYGSGKILFLYGTSNAGKTSICREITALNRNIIEDSIDAAMDRHYFDIISNAGSFKKYFFDRYSMISKSVNDCDLLDFLRGQKVKFKPLSTAEDQVNATKATSYVSIIEELFFSAFHRDAAQNNLFERALAISASGKDTIIDTVEFRDFLGYKISKSFHCPLLVTFIHCSFTKLAEHKEMRNYIALKTGHEENTRFGTYPFLQFSDFFKPREKIQEPCMHTINKKSVIHIYEQHLMEELQFRPVSGITKRDVQIRRLFELNILQKTFGFKDLCEEVQLTPRGYFDMEIDTEKYTPAQGASKILTFFLSR